LEVKVQASSVRAPLQVAPIKRAMVARIELITPEQREIAGKIVASGMKFYSPEIQKLYMKLGRFRNVILLDVKNQLERMIGQY
jgi:hypothetical protein